MLMHTSVVTQHSQLLLRLVNATVQLSGRPRQHPRILKKTLQFAEMLEAIFTGQVHDPIRPAYLTEELFIMKELDAAIGRMKSKRAADGCGLVVELLHHAPQELKQVSLDLYKGVLRKACHHPLGEKRWS